MATQQELYREILRNSQNNNLDGEAVVAALEAHRDRWLSYYPVREAGGDDVTLRDLASNQHDVDTVYVLCATKDRAEHIANTIGHRLGADEVDITGPAHEWGRTDQYTVRRWWD